MTGLFLVICACTLITICYSYAIISYKKGFDKLPLIDAAAEKQKNPVFVSVIIAARNESDNLPYCLDSLDKQAYPFNLFEVIIINDQSDDDTAAIASCKIANSKYKLSVLHTSGTGGKKQAIELGIRAATGEVLLMTDADCTFPPGWIATMAEAFKHEGKEYFFVAGPVVLKRTAGYFNYLQCLEFSSLIASTAGAIGINKPVMSNGANMAIRASVWKSELNVTSTDNPNKGLQLNKRYTSGDDMFSMLAITNTYGPDKIGFAKSTGALVYTNAKPDLQSLFNQRIRWVSKSRGYNDFTVIYAAVTVFAMNLILISVPLGALLYWLMADNITYLIPGIAAWFIIVLVKTLVDYKLLTAYTGFFGLKELKGILPAELIIAVFTVITAILGNVLPFSWKGRRMRH